MSKPASARAGYFKGDRLEIGMRYVYRPEFIPLLLDYLGARPGTRILEVGSGSGFLARTLARSLTGAHILALDTDEEMLDTAGEMLDRDGLDEQVHLTGGDTFHLPFPDDTFDLVTSQRLL